MSEDKEIRGFRDLMQTPDRLEEGFNWRTVIMALFVGLLMLRRKQICSSSPVSKWAWRRNG